MKKIPLPVLGAYPIKEWLTCPNKVRLDVSCPEELKTPLPPSVIERMESGLVFENEVYRKIVKVLRRKSVNWTFAVIEHENDRTPEGFARAEKLTQEALDAGAHVIWNARLRNKELVGVPDILIREDWSEDAPKPYKYLAADIKAHKAMEATKAATTYKTSTLAAPGYHNAVETLIVGTPKKVDSLQLVHYWKLLNSCGHAGAKIGAIYGKEELLVWRSLTEQCYNNKKDSAFSLYELALKGTQEEIMHEKRRIALDDGSLAPRSGPEKQAACSECPFKEVCYEQLVTQKHITLIPGITKARAQQHYDAGVKTYYQLANLDRETAELVHAKVNIPKILKAAKGLPGALEISALYGKIDSKDLTILENFKSSSGKTYNTLEDLRNTHLKTASYSTKVRNLPEAIDAARVRVVNRVHRKRDVVGSIHIPHATIEWDVDIEDVPIGKGQNLCYLIGVTETITYKKGATQTRFIPFVDWSGDPSSQQKTFRRFWNAMKRAEKKAAKLGGDLRCYVYSDHEFRFFKHLAKNYRGKDVPSVAQVEAYFESDGFGNPAGKGVFVDMYPIIQRELIWPTDSYSIKDLARFIMFFWRDDQPGGANSVAWAKEAMHNKDPKVREAFRQRILDYNEDDVLAMKAVRGWLSRFGTARRPGTKLPNVSVLDARFNAKAKAK